MSPEKAALVLERFLTNSEAYPQEWNDFAQAPRRGDLDNTTVAGLRAIIRELRSLE